MKIGIDCRVLTKTRYTGVENYAWNLVQNLIREDISNEYVLYFQETPSSQILSDLKILSVKTTIKIIPKILSWTQVALVLELFLNRVDVFFSPIHTYPIIAGLWTKIVVMIHGLEFEELKGGLLFSILKGKHEWFIANFANKILVPSENTKSQLVTRYKTPKSRILVISEGIDPQIIADPSVQAEEVLSKYSINNRYLIFVSTIEPRKNIPFLVEAFSYFLKKYPDFSDLQLIICGKKGWDFEESIQSPEKYNVGDKVRFLDYVPTPDLKVLLASSTAFVSASKNEGFGLHLVEAMAAKTKILVSNIPAYKEIGGDRLRYFEIGDLDEFADKLNNLISSKGNEIQNNYTDILEKYSWQNTARETLKVLNSLANNSTK